MLISVRATLQRPGDRAVPHFSGMTSITLDRARVLANQHLGELHDDDGQPFGAVALVVLRPADEPRVRLDFQEREDAPAGFRMPYPSNERVPIPARPLEEAP
jgi:hypothetical protein